MQRGANIKAVTEIGENCLHLACWNGAFGKDIIPLLIKAGADATSRTSKGFDVLGIAMQTNYDMAQTLFRHLPPGSKLKKNTRSKQDPIGNMAMRIQLGAAVKRFSDFERVKDANILWASLRNGKKQCFDESEDDIFEVLYKRDDPMLWILASREPCFQQHPPTGDTVLHMLCRTDSLSFEQNMEVFAALKKDHRNPLIPNFNNERAIDLTSDPALKVELARYMEWQPHRSVMHWYGPLFRTRAFALLLVLKRYPRAYVKDVRHLLVKYLAKVEHIYIPSKV